MSTWSLLAVAVVAEVVATVALRFAAGFTRLGPTLVVLAGYGVAFWLLSKVVQQLSASVTYAVWAGAGTALVTLVGVLALGEVMTWPKAASLALIVAGVVGLNVFGEAHQPARAAVTTSAHPAPAGSEATGAPAGHGDRTSPRGPDGPGGS